MDHWLVHEDGGMRVSVSAAKGQLTELVRLAEGGDEVVLTRHGQAVVRLVPVVKAMPTAEERRRVLEEIRAAGRAKATPGPSAARSQDFLYDEDGLPG
jgi:prevent-host-death family protein